jgi:uncharacterized membrane protein YheB (UPF0754 family)
MAAVATDLMLSKLLTTRELLDRIDGRELTARLQEPIRAAIDQMVRDVMARYQPVLWEALPESSREALIGAVQRRTPETVERLVEDLKRDPDSVVDLRGLMIDALTADPALLVRLVRRVGRHEMAFIVKVGAPFGFLLGAFQAVVWALTHNEWLVPVLGAFTGLFTDWVALQLIFRPIAPRRFLRVLRWQGLFHRRRDEVIADYADVFGVEILSPTNLMHAILTGPQADRLLDLVSREVDRALKAQVSPVKPLLVLAVGEQRYQEMRAYIVATTMSRMRGGLDEVGAYAMEALDVRGTLVTKMRALTDREYEGLLRPAFKQDEWKLIAVGGVLGFLIGELQVHLLLR